MGSISEILAIILGTGFLTFIYKNIELQKEKFVYQDSQSEWVTRLLEVAKTPNNDFGEKQALEIQSCLRPMAKKNSSILSDRDKFMNEAIKLCQKCCDKEMNNDEKRKLRFIVNVLLKEHWEHLENQNKFWWLRKSTNEWNEYIGVFFKEAKEELEKMESKKILRKKDNHGRSKV